MAERYGGPFSPQGKDAGDERRAQRPERGAPQGPPRHPFEGKRRSRAGARVNVLFFVAVPFALMAFAQPPVSMALDLAAFAVLTLAAWLTREGVIAQEAYEARSVARRPAIPRKIMGSVLTGIGLAIGGLIPGESWLHPLLFGLLGAGLHAFAFGPDPMKDKGMEGVDMFQTDRVARAVDEAEKHLAAMSDAIRRAGDRQLEARVDRFQRTARDMFRTVENDPRDLTAARKYLGVYLMGARDATVKFADIWSRSRDMQARADYESLLDDLEANFTARTRTLLLDDKTDLDVEIEVLRDRLKRDGLTAE